jgi:predicted helicase
VRDNIVIVFTDPSSQKPFTAFVSECVLDYHFVGAAAATNCLPLYRYDAEGERRDNITDWGLKQFRQHYGDAKTTKRDVFHYTYAVLHHPAYRAKYEVNLKRGFPRLPFYKDFRQWTRCGKALMEMHLGYEQAAPFALAREDRKESVSDQTDLLLDERVKPTRLLDDKPALKPKLKADKAAGVIEVDAITSLRGIPPEAWNYKLGNRSALEWVLDQWKEHKISDPTVAEKFNTYRFADHKEHVIDLLHRVCTVNLETMKIVNAMPVSDERK